MNKQKNPVKKNADNQKSKWRQQQIKKTRQFRKNLIGLVAFIGLLVVTGIILFMYSDHEENANQADVLTMDVGQAERLAQCKAAVEQSPDNPEKPENYGMPLGATVHGVIEMTGQDYIILKYYADKHSYGKLEKNASCMFDTDGNLTDINII